MKKFIRFEESRPAAVREVLAESPVAYVPFGALEWHGEHGPLGLDGLKAHALCLLAAEQTGGVVFPPMFWGAFDTVPFPFTFHFKKARLKGQIRETLDQLRGFGFQVMVLLTGHYPPSLVKLLKKECRRFSKKSGAWAIGVPEQVFATDLDYFGDHAGMWESSIMLALRPELLDLSAMPAGLTTLERLKQYCVMGQDPTTQASAEKGQQAIAQIVKNLAKVVERTLEEKSDRALEEVYASYNRALRPSRRLVREALDVHSLKELIQYGWWTWRNL